MKSSLFEIAKRVADNKLIITREEAIDLPFLLNPKKGQYCIYYWNRNKVYISIWDLELNIVENINNINKKDK